MTNVPSVQVSSSAPYYTPASSGTSSAAWAVNAKVAASEATTSTSFTDLATSGPAVTVTVPADGRLRVVLSASITQSTAGNQGSMSFAMSGSNTKTGAQSQTDGGGALTMKAGQNNQIMDVSRELFFTGLTPGETTLTCKYLAAAGGTATFAARSITAFPAPLP